MPGKKRPARSSGFAAPYLEKDVFRFFVQVARFIAWRFRVNLIRARHEADCRDGRCTREDGMEMFSEEERRVAEKARAQKPGDPFAGIDAVMNYQENAKHAVRFIQVLCREVRRRGRDRA